MQYSKALKHLVLIKYLFHFSFQKDSNDFASKCGVEELSGGYQIREMGKGEFRI